MEIKPDEITSILKGRIEGLDAGEANLSEVGTVLSVGDGIARIHGLDNAMALGDARVSRTASTGMALNLEEDNVGAVIFGEMRHRSAKATRSSAPAASLECRSATAARPRGRRARPADRRQGPDRHDRDAPRRAQGARRRRPPAGAGAAADRHQGDRRDDPDRPRPARADHRRPPDRQDRHRDRHDHQPEGQRRHLHLRRDRPEGSTVAQVVETLASAGAMDYTIVVAATASDSAPLQYIAPYAGCAMGEYFMRQRPARADHLRRPVQAGRRLPPAVAAAAPPAGPRGVSRATCSTCTAACSSAPPS